MVVIQLESKVYFPISRACSGTQEGSITVFEYFIKNNDNCHSVIVGSLSAVYLTLPPMLLNDLQKVLRQIVVMMASNYFNLHQQEKVVWRLCTTTNSRMSSELNLVLGLSHIASLPMLGLMLFNKYVISNMGNH